jgi:osmoprotectant transport system substrate-binding protein
VNRRLGLVGAVVAAGVLIGACAADLPAVDTDAGDAALSWNDDVDLAGLELAVGSTSTVEQQVLGHLAIEALTAAGAEVIDQVDLGGTLVVRDAQLGGLIDLYWEYTGTGWVELLREIGPSDDADELAEAVADTDLDENAISWLSPAPANSSFAIATGPNVADGLSAETISELGELLEDEAEGVVLCLPDGGGFRDDPTGLPGFARALELEPADDQIVVVPRADLVPAVEAGVFCPFGQVRRTSPTLLDADVDLLEDDVGAFLIRNPAVTVRAEVLAEFPGIADVLEPVAAALTDEQLQLLNGAVAVEGREPRQIARAWLVDEGFADR